MNGQAGKDMKALSLEALDAVGRHSAGEMGRRQNWSFFVKHLYDHNLLELADECVGAMSKDQRRQFFARHKK